MTHNLNWYLIDKVLGTKEPKYKDIPTNLRSTELGVNRMAKTHIVSKAILIFRNLSGKTYRKTR